MNIEIRLFDNFKEQKTETEGKFTPKNEKLFKDHMPKILKSWGAYLRTYADKSEAMFGAPEYPWKKFDEPTWVSSLTVAIARKYRKAILVEELPVIKRSSREGELINQKGKKTDFGNADLWCCLDHDVGAKENIFSFYLEAKFASFSRRQITGAIENHKPIKLENIQKQIASNTTQDSILSRVFRDYQKSAGKQATQRNFTTTSPHKNEKNRKHAHVFLTLLIKPVFWDKSEEWKKQINFSDIFANGKVRVQHKKSTSDTIPQRNLYKFPSTGIIMRDKDGYGFIALILMLGETKNKEAN